MDNTEWDTNSFYGDKFPINIPSPDAAWNDMRKKLENDRKRKPYWWVFIFLMTGIVLLSIITVNFSTNSDGKKTNTASNDKLLVSAAETNKLNANNTNDTLRNAVRSGDKNINPVTQSNTEIPGKMASADSPVTGFSTVNNFNLVKPNSTESKQTNVKAYPKKAAPTRRTKNFVVNHTRQHVAAGITSSVPDDAPADSKQELQLVKDTVAANIDNITTLKNKQQVTDSLKEDTAEEDSTEEENDDDSTHFIAEAGLQWNVQLPFENGGSYFAGSGTQSQPYRILLPSAWINWHAGRSLLGIQVNPFASLLTSDKPFKTVVTRSTVYDTAITKTQTMTLNKLFGVTAGLGYDYNIAGNWWAGGNLQANWWSSGIATSSVKTSKQSLSGSFNPINTQSSNQYTLSNVDWENLSAFQMQLNLELLYRKKSWVAGFNAGFPLTSITKTGGSLSYFYAALLFRLRVWTNEK